MKRFLIKLSLIIVPFILLLFVLNFAYLNSYYWLEQRDEAKFRNVPENIQLANLGSSHGFYTFIYNDFPEYVTFNFGMKAQHHVFNYYVLKQYLNNFSQNSVVLIPISYFDITRIMQEHHFRYYTFLDKENLPDWKKTEYLLYNYFPLFTVKKAWKRLLIMNKKETAPDFLSRAREDFVSHSEFLFNWWTAKDSEEKGEKGFQYNIEAVSKIIDLCYEHKIIPVLVTTPQTDVLNNLYAQIDFFDTFYRFTDTLKEKYPGLIYLDYSQKPEYSSDYSLFFDATHLNKKGAKKFTAQIVQDLKDAGLLQ